MNQLRISLFIVLALTISNRSNAQQSVEQIAGFYALPRPSPIIFHQLDGSQFESRNYGLSWTRLEIGKDPLGSAFDKLPPPRQINFTDLHGIRYVSDDGGLTYWLQSAKSAEATASTNTGRESKQVKAAKVFPNPANSKVKFAFEAEVGSVSIALFDAKGVEVLKKYEAQRSSGEKVVELSIDNLSDGNYFYLIEANGKTLYSSSFTISR